MAGAIGILVGILFTSLSGMLTRSLLELANIIMGFINDMTSNYWEHPVIQTIIASYGGFSFLILIASMLAMFFDVAEETMSSKAIDYGTVFFNFIKAFTFCITVPLLCSFSVEVGNVITQAIGFGKGLDLDYTGIDSVIQQFNPFMVLLVAVLLIIATIGFLIMSVTRFSHMLIHLLTAIFYIPDIVRGNTASIGDWTKQMVAIAGTFVIQYLLFAVGLDVFITNDLLLAMGMWIGMFSVPKLLGKFGMSSGVAGLGNATMNMGQKAMTIFR